MLFQMKYHVWMLTDARDRRFCEETLALAEAKELKYTNLFAQQCIWVLASEAIA